MAEGLREMRLGRPRKYSEGWKGANKWIYINGGDLEKSRVYPMMILWHAIYLLNNLVRCNKHYNYYHFVWNKFPWLTKELHKLLQTAICYIYIREVLLLCPPLPKDKPFGRKGHQKMRHLGGHHTLFAMI